MGNVPHFWFDVAACALLAILFWGACAGIGNRILPRPSASPPDEEATNDGGAPPATWHQPGVAACVGLGVLLALGGVGVLFRIPWWLVVVPFLVAGMVLAIRDLSRAGIASASTLAVVIGTLCVVALVLVALVEAPLGLRFPLNVCDDFRAYLPYAHRILDTNGLEARWSQHRVQTVGGFTLLRAYSVAVFGNAGVGVPETVLAGVFLGGLFVANGVRSTWAKIVSLLLVVSVPLLWIPRTNTTGVLMGCPLTVVVLATVVEQRAALSKGDRRAAIRWSIASGLVVAALMSVRPNLGLVGAATIVLGLLLMTGVGWRARIQVLATAAASSLLAFLPWSVAMWQSVRSPLYPLFSGNLNMSAYPHKRLTGIADLAEHTYDLVRAGPYLRVTVAVVIVAVIARKVLPDALLVGVAAVVTLGVTVAFAANTPFVPWTTFIRYVSPMSGGLAVFMVCEMLRGADAREQRASRPLRAWALPMIGLLSAVALAGVAFSSLGFAIPPFHSGVGLLVDAAENRIVPLPGQEISTPALRQAFADAFGDLDPRRTIAAVDRPYLIDYARHDVPNLDAPGFMTPDGKGFPFFQGPAAKVARLRGAGFDTLVATDPVRDVCLDPVRIAAAVPYRPDDRPVYDRFLDWGHDIQEIVRAAPRSVRRYGNLLVIDLPRAEQALRAGNSP